MASFGISRSTSSPARYHWTSVLAANRCRLCRARHKRHHFALSNLNRWATDGVDVNSMLPYLSRYMGHSCIESTDYYLHLVPEFFHTFSEKVRPTETLLPELDYDKE